MTPLLEQFIQEARDFLQGIGEKLMALESRPDDVELMTELFRLVHTLKGNSGLFQFPDMTRVLHAGEDLMDAVRDGRVAYSQDLADTLLDAMDYVSAQLDEIEETGVLRAAHAEEATRQAAKLRALIPACETGAEENVAASAEAAQELPPPVALSDLPEAVLSEVWAAAAPEVPLLRVLYAPEPECFFKGEDPFHQARQIPGLVWGRARHIGPWPPLAEFDCYRCELIFDALARADRASVVEHFRYVPEQVAIDELPLVSLAIPQGDPNGGLAYSDFVTEALALLDAGDMGKLRAAVGNMRDLSAPESWGASALRWIERVLDSDPTQTQALRRLIESLKTLTPPEWSAEDGQSGATAVAAKEAPPEVASMPPADALPPAPDAPPPLSEADRGLIEDLLAVQAEVLALPDGVDWLTGRLKACAASLGSLLSHLGKTADEMDEALGKALAAHSAQPLAQWLAAFRNGLDLAATEAMPKVPPVLAVVPPAPSFERPPSPAAASARTEHRAENGGEVKFGRRAEDAIGSKVLKVDQAKVDRLMNLIGEMVVAKNSLPYLAKRAEDDYGVRELAREIKAQYAVINRIAEEMQDAIMQVRMMPLSFVFQRFPRLVRDISRKLGKEVELVLEGGETEADKTIVEALADPLVHIVRNSLDHGIETPEVRTAAGKSPTGRLLIRAQHESDRVVIEIIDDGKGIDPAVIKREAYGKGLIDETEIERISDQEAINLVFLPGFSTAEQVSDLSGRGVGMDVVRNALDKVGGSVRLASEVGKGTHLTLTLPLSMAVTNVMIVESDRQIFGVPMEQVVETVRVPRGEIRTIKGRQTTVLRDRIVPLIALNDLLGIAAQPLANDADELATLVVRVGGEAVGILVDNFREVVDVILKPLPGDLVKLSCYAGTALLGDGSVLMILNLKELIR